MFNQVQGDMICAGLMAGQSLRKAAKTAGVPPSTVLLWVKDNKEFAEQYARAREVGYQLLADEILEISDDASGDVIETENGPKMSAEFVARARLRVDSRKWMLAKMLPKVYGDKTTLSNDPEAPLAGVVLIPMKASQIDA